MLQERVPPNLPPSNGAYNHSNEALLANQLMASQSAALSQRVPLNPISVVTGMGAPYTYDPFIAIPEMFVLDQNNQQRSLKEIAFEFFQANRKLTPDVREALIKFVNPLISVSYPLNFGFLSKSNNLVVESIIGYQRLLTYQDTTFTEIIRCHGIPKDSSDPELHYQFVFS